VAKGKHAYNNKLVYYGVLVYLGDTAWQLAHIAVNDRQVGMKPLASTIKLYWQKNEFFAIFHSLLRQN